MALSDQQIDSLGRQAVQRAAAGDFTSAEVLFARIVDARPNSGQILHFLGQVRLKLGRFADAKEPLERAARFMPRDPTAHTNLAGCLMRLGEYGAALAALEHAARLRPEDAAIAHNIGHALTALGRVGEAEAAYDRALSIDNRLVPSLAARADLLLARGEWAGALADLDTALVSRPSDPQLRIKRGELLLRQGDWWRGLADHEARLEIPLDRYTPNLPRWQGEPLGGRLLIYPEQADIESDAALRDVLMLARGVDGVVQCASRLGAVLDAPTVCRGDPLDGFAAATPLRSLPHLLGWTLETLPPPPRLKPRAEPTNRVGWFSTRKPPDTIEITGEIGEIASCRLVIGADAWPAHFAAAIGIPTVILVPRIADWLWGPNLGRSPWYAFVELLHDDDREGLAARVAGC